jgi:diguanylate cyclase (GGDEF)-like protein
MNDSQTALIEMIDKIEALSLFQDKVEIPASIETIWEIFLEHIRNLIAVDGCALFMVDDASHEFRLSSTAPAGLKSVFQKEIDAQIEYGIFSWIVKRRLPALIPPFFFEPGKSVIMLPLATVKRTLGMVMATSPIQESHLTHETLRLLSMLSRQCSLVMENVLLYRGLEKKTDSLEKAYKQIRYLSQRDPLTGCYNRGYMNENLPREIRRAMRYRRAFSLSMCDIDHFKAVNDIHGHQCGDQVLREFVKAVNELIRTDSDWFARYGGEEFLLVLPETSLDNATRLSERLRIHIAARGFGCQGENIRITASFGVVGFDAEEVPAGLQSDAVLNRADELLYEAKKKGRNRVASGTFAAGAAAS